MKLIFSASKMSFFLFFAIAFPVMINIKFILSLWLVNPPEMTDVFLCLIVGYSIFDSFSIPLWQSVHATGHLKVHQILMASMKLANIPLSYVCLKLGAPIYSVLIVYMVINALCSAVRIVYLRTLIHLNVRDYLKDVISQMLKIVIISIPIPLLIMLLSDNRGFAFFSTCISFYSLYIPGIYLLALNDRERELVRGMARKVFYNFLRR